MSIKKINWFAGRVVLATVAATSLARGQVTPTVLVSATPAGASAGNYSDNAAMSGDGHFIAFQSAAPDLVPGIIGQPDIFIRDLVTGETSLVSVDSMGIQANSSSNHPAISADGRFVAFESNATNLVAGDLNGLNDIFVRDRLLGSTIRVSVSTLGAEANGGCFRPVMSDDGRYVAFDTEATTMYGGDFNGVTDVYVHDTVTGQTTIGSVSSFGLLGDQASFSGALSGDGRYLVFLSAAKTLVLGDTNGSADVFLRDRQTGETTRVSEGLNGQQAYGSYGLPLDISADGRFVVFSSSSANLAANDLNGGLDDIFVHDRQTGETTVASVSTDGQQGTAGSQTQHPVISNDGRYVAFESTSPNFAANDLNSLWDVFVHDRQGGGTSRVSDVPAGTEGYGNSVSPTMSGDGRYVCFHSLASFLPVDDNQYDDVYVSEPWFLWTGLAAGLAGQNGTPVLHGTGTLQGLTIVTLTLTGGLSLAPDYFIVGLSAISAPFKGGTLVPNPDLLFAMQTDQGGKIIFPVLWPPGIPSGLSLFMQHWSIDPAGPFGFTASNAVKATMP